MVNIEWVSDEYVRRTVRVSGDVPYPFYVRIYSATDGAMWYINAVGYGEDIPVHPEFAEILESAYKTRGNTEK